MKFKKGDIVKISEKSEYQGYQSHDTDGTLREFHVVVINERGSIKAQSTSGYSNTYCEHDLELFHPKETKKTKKTRGREVIEVEPENSMRNIYDVLEKVYSNKELRSSVVPLFLGDPGLGKTKVIESFAKAKGAKLVELITSQMSPFEVSGIAMPDKDTKKMTYFNFDKIDSLKSGDILFFDELLNGSPVILNACLTILEQRTLISGKKLPNIMIIAAANPQGMMPLTPQIKERFIWYPVVFSPIMWKEYMLKKYKMPESISEKLCTLIKDEEFASNNFHTPRSIDKAVAMIARDCFTPYQDILTPILSELITNKFKKRRIRINKTKFLNPSESMMWIDFLKKSKL